MPDINENALIKVLSDKHLLIATVHFLTFGDNATWNDIFLVYKGDKLAIPINFIDEPGKEPFMAVNDEYAKDGFIGLTFINFSQKNGVWSHTAYNIGKIAGCKLFVRAKITASPSEPKYNEVLMSFYVELDDDADQAG
jgi:hypothetical protein